MVAIFIVLVLKWRKCSRDLGRMLMNFSVFVTMNHFNTLITVLIFADIFNTRDNFLIMHITRRPFPLYDLFLIMTMLAMLMLMIMTMIMSMTMLMIVPVFMSVSSTAIREQPM